ncbi:hypothetical protein BHM03_00059536 [Ensete ventricosum]|nr:hypothetical protein BHM03_00059536 [Ensete ventricosum]
MVWRGCSVLLLLLVLCFLTWSQAAGNNTYDLSAEEDRELERELQTLNKPFVKSFKLVCNVCSSPEHITHLYIYVFWISR